MTKRKAEKKAETKEKEAEKEKKTTSTSSTEEFPPEVEALVAQAAPFMKMLGIQREQIPVYIKLPQILDALAQRLFDLENGFKQLVTGMQGSKGPGTPATPPGFSLNSGHDSSHSGSPGGGGWLESFAKSPEGQRLITNLANAFIGGSSESPVDNEYVEIAKAIQAGIKSETIKRLRTAFNVGSDFIKEVEK